jgi:uncharacterized protein
MSDNDPLAGLAAELAALRERVPGVRGSILAGVDGLLLFQDGLTGHDPHDLAALAAAAYGIGSQTGHILRYGRHEETTIHAAGGYYTVYSVNASILLGVLGETGLNVARLHIEFRAGLERINATVQAGASGLVALRPRM